MVASAAFTVEGGDPQGGVSATAAQEINLALVSVSDARSVEWIVLGSSDPNVTDPVITSAGTPSGVTASFTMPTPADADEGYSLVVRCRVNGGLSGGVADQTLVRTALIGVQNINGEIPMAYGETSERSLTHHWVPFINRSLVQVGGTADANAIHDNVSGEIVAVTEKASPVSADVLLIEDSEAANVKKCVQLGNLPGGTDANAIHDNVSGEIAAITGKATPTTSDFLLIEDAAASNAKKSVTVGDVLGAGLTASAPANVTKAAAAVGVATSAARADHKHDITTAAPGATGLGTTSGEGSATTVARSDHTHQSNTAPVAVTKAAAAIGTSGEPARADHKHDVSTAAPAATGVATSSGEGSATTLARSDHTHQANTAPVNVTKAAAAIGTSGQPARADHKHDVTTAAAVELTDSTNAEGNATSLARSNHTHAHGQRGGGALHAGATTSVAGFMSSGDKAKLDTITVEFSGSDATRQRADGLYSQSEIADSFSVEVDTADSPAASSLLRDNAGNAVSLAEGFTYYFEVTVETNDGSADEWGKYLVVANRRSGGNVAFSGSIQSSGDATTSGLDMQFAEDTGNQLITCQPTVGGKAGDRKVRWSVKVERRPVVTEDT